MRQYQIANSRRSTMMAQENENHWQFKFTSFFFPLLPVFRFFRSPLPDFLRLYIFNAIIFRT